jgi:F-type H+-transporting ATPase subunit delta
LIHQSIARRYARGVFAVGEKDGKYRDYLREMDDILGLFGKEPRLSKALMLPILEISRRGELLKDVLKVLGTSASMSNVLTMLLEKNRMEYLPAIRDQYIDLVDEKEGRVKGTLWSAYPVDAAVKGRIEEAMGEKTHKQVVLETLEDKTLIGGIKINIRGTIIDGSVKRQLETLKENILKE